jgi:hypothetical protein
VTRLGKIRSLLLALAVGCILWGLWRGEARIILQKAVRVCMECIGLG